MVEKGLCKICAKPVSKRNKQFCNFHREKDLEQKRKYYSKLNKTINI